MANSNVNIANKLFSYIAHGVDITPEIKDVYRNSLIFIGDEQQIYVPVMNTYVGMGVTSYNTTNTRIDELNTKLEQLANTLAKDLVSRIFVNYSFDEMTANRSGVSSDTNNGGAEVRYDDSWYLNNDITLKGVNNYDITTHHAATSYTMYDVTGKPVGSRDNPHQFNIDKPAKYADSGITLTAHRGDKQFVWNASTHSYIEKYVGSYITIDDKQTWSYMTSAYAYTMSFAEQYTNTEIDRLYHNLLGDVNTYVPVTFESVYKIIEQPQVYDPETGTYSYGNVDHVFDTSYYDYDESKNYYYRVAANTEGAVQSSYDGYWYKQWHNSDWTDQIPTSTNHYSIDEAPIANFPQLYVFGTTYNSTYNTSLRDGINTLKEVAYLLDILTDGLLGEVTYCTWGEVKTWSETLPVVDSATHTFTYANGLGGVAYVTDYAFNKRSLKDSDTYCYYTNVNPENLGITMAYSIAGNKQDIIDLHRHVNDVEYGKTTLRSVQTTTASQFGRIETIGGSTEWQNTDNDIVGDINKDPNYSGEGHTKNNSYLVGDVNLQVKLNTAYTYVTYNTSNGIMSENTENLTVSHKGIFSTQWHGSYQLADTYSLTIGGSYYTVGNNDTMVAYNVTIVDPHDIGFNTTDTLYWKAPGSEEGDNLNPNWKKLTLSEFVDLNSAGKIGGQNSILADGWLYANDSFTKISGGTLAAQVDYILANRTPIVYYVESFDRAVYHAEIPDENKLATTDWVGAHVDAKVSELEDMFDNIAESAKEYTDKKIAALDANYKYSDFGTLYWNSYVTYWGLIPGTTDYISAYEAEYVKFVDEDLVNAIDPSTGEPAGAIDYANSLRNKLKSGVLNNVTEEDGIVSAESRELPSDRIITNTIIYGEQDNIAAADRFVYTALTAADLGTFDLTDANYSLLEALYRWKKSISGNEYDNQIFVTDSENKIFTACTDATLSSLNGYYIHDSVTDSYIELSDTTKISYDDAARIQLGWEYGPSHFWWRQVYVLVTKYVELDLSKASTSATDNIPSALTITGPNGVVYTLTPDSTTGVVVSGTGSDGSLYYISSKPTGSVKYLTSDQKHFAYNNGGTGENEVSVTAHIVKLEDAAADNTGFADAFDVKEYIENRLGWINISASITAQEILTRSVFYDLIDNEDYSAITGTKPALYAQNVSNQFVSVEPNYSYFSNEDNRWLAADDGNSTYRFSRTNNSAGKTFNPGEDNYYVKNADPFINPVNLTITKYGAPTV